MAAAEKGGMRCTAALVVGAAGVRWRAAGLATGRCRGDGSAAVVVPVYENLPVVLRLGQVLRSPPAHFRVLQLDAGALSSVCAQDRAAAAIPAAAAPAAIPLAAAAAAATAGLLLPSPLAACC